MEECLKYNVDDKVNNGHDAKERLKFLLNFYSDALDKKSEQSTRIQQLEDVIGELFRLGISVPESKQSVLSSASSSTSTATDPVAAAAIVQSLSQACNKELKIPYFGRARNESVDD